MIANKTLAIVFILLLFAPILLGNWLTDSPAQSENRNSSELPTLQLLYLEPVKSFARIEAYFNERYGFRQALIRLHGLFKYYILHTSSTADVLLGKNDWLFWTQKADGDPLAYFIGVRTLNENELAAITSTLNQRYNWMQMRGVEYYFMIAPNKSTIYPDYLPDYLTPSLNEHRIANVVKSSMAAGFENIVDPGASLMEGRHSGAVFHRTDSHWTSFGAYLAYLELIASIQQRYRDVSPLQLADKNFIELPGAWMWQTPTLPIHFVKNAAVSIKQLPGDLARQLGLSNDLADQSNVPPPLQDRCADVIDTPYRPGSWKQSDGSHPELGHKGLLTTYCEDRQYTALVIHDSFGPLLVPYLSETFRQVTYVWGDHFDYAQEFVNEIDVDFVIHVHVERHLLPDYIW